MSEVLQPPWPPETTSKYGRITVVCHVPTDNDNFCKKEFMSEIEKIKKSLESKLEN